MTANEQAEPSEPTGGERAAEGARKDAANGAKPAVADAKAGAKPATAAAKPAAAGAQPAAAGAEPAGAGAKPAAAAGKPAEPAKPAAEPTKPAAAAKAGAAAKSGAAVEAGAAAKDAPVADAATKAGTPVKDATKPDATKPDATKAATAAKPGDAAKADGKTKVDDKTKVDVMASDGKPEPDDDKPGKAAAARRADKNAPGKRWNRWYWVLGRGFITATIGVVAILLGVFVLPKFVDTNVSANQGPPSPFATGPDIPGSLPNGGNLTGTPAPGTGMPTPNGPVQTQPGRPADALGAWAVNLSKLGIPQVALQSYGYAESVLAQTQPNCHLSWTMVAGIGSIESNHGRHGGATLQADGTSVPKILGVQLSGATTERIPDTDKGVLDQDTKFDRAMGAMQFIPSTWKKWGIDADNDGKADPFDLDDAAVSSGYYLCAGGRDLSTADGWWSAVLSYNNLTTYATNVYLVADSYGLKSTQ